MQDDLSVSIVVFFSSAQLEGRHPSDVRLRQRVSAR